MSIQEKMSKTIEALTRQFDTIRTGRANPQLLDRLMVDYYGSLVPLKQVASISVPEPMTLVLSIFDKSAVQDVEKAILSSELGLNPQTEGGTIILRIPPLTNDRRQELIKVSGKYAEDAKVALRNIRRDEIDAVKAEDGLSEDDVKKEQDGIQKATDSFSKKIDELLKEKETEILTV